MSVLFTGAAAGDIADATAYSANWDLLESSLDDIGEYVISGLVPSAGTGMAVNVTAGTASIGGRVTKGAGFSIGSLTPSSTNHLFLLQNGTGTSNTTGTQPALSVKLGTATTDGVSVTAVNILRSSGRQFFRRPDQLIPGGSAAGHPPSINLALWGAAAGDGVTVYGTLPPGAGSTGQAAWTAPPLAATWTPINVTTATLIDSASGGLFLGAANIAAGHAQCWVKTLAAGAYTLTVRLDMMLGSTTFTAGGIVMRDSASGKLLTLEQYIFGDGPFLAVTQWSDANTRFGTSYGGGTLSQLFPWLRITDDGATNRHYSFSTNGNDWLEFAFETRTNYLGVAPDQIGVFAVANGGPAGVNLWSWAGA